MSSPEEMVINTEHLDPISKIRIDSSQWIETIFIKFLPNKEDIRRYYFDNKLLTKKEAIELAHKRNIKKPENTDKHHFFIYHEHLGIVPFEKWDIVMTDEWYSTTDWERVLCYDNNWNELWFF